MSRTLRDFTGFSGVGCHAEYPPDRDVRLCSACTHLLEAEYDLERLRRRLDRDRLLARPASVWRWRELLPVLDPERIVTPGEGGTPLLCSMRLPDAIGVRELWLKCDTMNPTGSLKDRSITVSATKALEFGRIGARAGRASGFCRPASGAARAGTR